MSYRKFHIEDLQTKLGVHQTTDELFKNIIINLVQPSNLLVDTLASKSQMMITTEKAVCEHWVSPILSEIKLRNADTIELYSGEQLNVDTKKGLNGEIDFIFSKSPKSYSIQAPVFCITEAKIGRLDKALPQAIAQMCGASLFNEQKGKMLPFIYGAVTDGKTWQFILLQNQIAYVDTNTFYLADLPKLLGVLQYIVNLYATE
jgi:hypothetical protein